MSYPKQAAWVIEKTAESERRDSMDTHILIRSTRHQITDRLREDIFSGRLAEGQRLQEAKLSAQFGVSRGPIREALAQLTQEGLLEAKPNRGVSVSHSDSD